MTVVLEEAAAGWENEGVRWALLRGRATLDVAGYDVDLLVTAEDLGAFEAVVRRNGGTPYPRWTHPRARLFDLSGLKLDVVTELTYGRCRPVASRLEDGCLARRVRRDWLWELSPTDTFWTVLLHCLYDKKVIKERRAKELRDALPSVLRHGPAEDRVAQLLPQDWPPDRLLDLVTAERWADLEWLARQLPASGARLPSVAGVGAFSRAAAAHVVVRAARRANRLTEQGD